MVLNYIKQYKFKILMDHTVTANDTSNPQFLNDSTMALLK